MTVQAKRVAVGLLAVICVPHIHSLVYSKAQHNIWWVCWEDPNSLVARVLGATVEFSIGCLVIVVVFLLNVVLSVYIYSNRIPSSAPSSSSNLTSYKRQSANKRLTRTLLVVAIVFVVCETPRMVMSFLVKFIERTPIRRIILNASYALSGVNHAANFFIYIVLSPRFRQLLVESLHPAVTSLARCLRRCRPSMPWTRPRIRQHVPDTLHAPGGRRRPRWYRRFGRQVADNGSRDVTVQFNLDVLVGPPE